MNNFGKVALVAGIAAGVIAVIKVTTKKKYTEVDVEVKEEKKESGFKKVLNQIKEAATEKAIKIIGWAVDHMKQIQAASEIIGLVGGVVSLGYSFYQFKHKGKLEKKIDNLENVIKEQNAKKDLYNWVDGFNHGATEQFNRALDEADRCTKNNDTFKFIDKNGQLIREFAMKEVTA